MKLFFLPLLLGVTLISCTSDSPEDLTDDTLPTVEANKINFTEHIKPIVDRSCATSGCHDTQTKTRGFDFYIFQDVLRGFKEGTSISRMQNSSNPMPPTGKLPQSQIDLVLKWQQNNFPFDAAAIDSSDDNSDDNSDNKPTIVSYTENIKPIIDQSCAVSGCHGNGSSSAGLSLETFNQVKASFSNTGANGSLNRVERTQGSRGMMPRNGTRLSNDKIQLLRDWINGDFVESN